MFFLIIAILLGVAGLGFGVFVFIRGTLSRAEETKNAWKYKQFSPGGKLALFLGVLVSLGGIPLTILGATNPDYWYLGLSCLVSIGVSIAMAYICSPMVLTVLPVLDMTKGAVNSEGGLEGGVYGCLIMFIYVPIGLGIGIVSFTAVIIGSWVFALMALYRGTKKWVKIFSLILVAAILLSIPCSFFINGIVMENNQEKDYSSIQLALDTENTQKLTFLESDINYFNQARTKKMVAEKLSEFYRNRDIEGIFKIVDFALANQPDLLLNVEKKSLSKGNIVFTKDFYSFVENEIKTNGVKHSVKKYTYRNYTVHFVNSNDIMIMNADYDWVDIALESVTHSYGADYFLVGETVELHEKKGGLRENNN